MLRIDPTLGSSHGTRKPGVPRRNPNEENTMTNMKQLVKNLINEDSGQDLIEYALVAALVGLGAVAAMKGLSNSIGNTFNGVGNSLTNAVL